MVGGLTWDVLSVDVRPVDCVKVEYFCPGGFSGGILAGGFYRGVLSGGGGCPRGFVQGGFVLESNLHCLD